MVFGLIGEKLTHSFSKEIHEAISDITYDLIPLDEKNFHEFMHKKAFKAINVTIPYKEKVIPYLAFIDEHALSIGAINTIINENNQLYGYNSDYLGIMYLLKQNSIELANKTIAILGSGGTCKSVNYVCEHLGAKQIYKASRSLKDGFISYEQLKNKGSEIDIIINTTPCGMYPHNEEAPLDLNAFLHLQSVVDVIYNPLRTKLVLDALKQGVKGVGGLEMLIAQGVYANEYFIKQKHEQNLINTLYLKQLKKQQNIALIGMPTSGKTTIGRRLAQILDKQFIDIDEMIIQEANMDIKDIFALHDEAYFRAIETKCLKKVAYEHCALISCGGGIIKQSENIEVLQQNSLIIYIDRPLNLLTSDQERPLSNSLEAIEKLYLERKDIYTKACDIKVSNATTIDECIKECLDEITSYKWA